MTHGRGDEAERVVDEIEARLVRDGHVLPPVAEDQALTIRSGGC